MRNKLFTSAFLLSAATCMATTGCHGDEVEDLGDESLELNDSTGLELDVDAAGQDEDLEQIERNHIASPEGWPEEAQNGKGAAKAQSWCFGFPTTMYAAAGQWANTTQGDVFNTTGLAYYNFDATVSPAPQNFALSVEDANSSLLNRVTENGIINQPALLDTQNYALFQIRPPAGTSGAVEYEVHAETQNTIGQVVCSQDITVEVINCEQPATWFDGVDRQATWAGATCEVEQVPGGAAPFIYNNTFYIESDPTTDCPYGTWDGTGCYLMPEPAAGVITQNPDAFVIGPNGGVPPLCPADWDWDPNSQECSKSIPWGHWGFVENGNWYLSPDLTCSTGNFDGRNCVMGQPPAGSTALVVGSEFHYEN